MGSDILREDMLVLLSTMGVELPENTKIPDDGLNKLLLQALDASQRFTDLLKTAPFNPSEYHRWKSPKPLLEAVSRGNLTEAFENAMSGNKARGTSTAKEDTFREVRQILLALSMHYDQGTRDFVLLDTTEEWGIVIRIVDLFSLPFGDLEQTDVPIFGLLYKVVNRTNKLTLYERLNQMFNESIVSISTTELERKTMLKLFVLNGKRLSSEYKPRRNAKEDSHRLSFLLPLGPLNMRDLGKLNNLPGCEICGKRVTSRCTQCLTVSYCGTECQREDWKVHKQRCRSLKGGTWHTLTFEKNYGSPGLVASRLVVNRFDSAHDTQSMIENDLGVPPIDIHGEKPFLIKLQIALHQFGDDASMLVYDRQKSFQAYWKKSADRDIFTEGQKAMTGNLKIYRWARRVGDYQLSVCFDRAPEKNPVW
ncbi:hypothetical protein BDZ94DRAFT_1264418 [Collybia nuda]|uniref:MYND-type domain-containing protein n=1 Tax=Collybia nuda TaxID=64659 RepID=A0A9P6CHP7_9AGAR|nr:hypothetical protein BDZ94DRAFT_1264418 [Collybia nuda]